MSYTGDTPLNNLTDKPMTDGERKRYLTHERVKRWRRNHRETDLSRRKGYNKRAKENEVNRQKTIKLLEQEEDALDRLTVVELLKTLVGMLT
jgi:hypothetical protein